MVVEKEDEEYTVRNYATNRGIQFICPRIRGKALANDDQHVFYFKLFKPGNELLTLSSSPAGFTEKVTIELAQNGYQERNLLCIEVSDGNYFNDGVCKLEVYYLQNDSLHLVGLDQFVLQSD